MPDQDDDGGQTIETARLTLRAPRAADAAALVALANNPRVAAGAALLPAPFAVADARAWIAAAGQGPGENFVAVARAGRAVVGAAGYGPHLGRDEELVLIYWLGEPFWRRGFATEAAQAVVDRAFARGAERLWGVCRVTNSRARRVIEKCGFQYRENGMIHSRALKGAMPVERYVLERSVWASLKAWGRGAGAELSDAGCL